MSREHVERLMQSHADIQRKLEEVTQEHLFASENAQRLEQIIQDRDRDYSSANSERQRQLEELDSLRDRLSQIDKDHSRALAERARIIEDLENNLRLVNQRYESIISEKAKRDIYLSSLEEKANSRLDEGDRLRRRIHELEQESAAKEVRLLDLDRERERVREDNTNLNIALDSKQQELELVCYLLHVDIHLLILF